MINGLFENAYGLFGARTAAAEWASILALFISGYAAYAITKVRSQILGRVRLPGLFAELEKKTGDLANLMLDFDGNKEQIGLVLAVCETNLRLLAISVKGSAKASARSVMKEIRAYEGRNSKFTFFNQPENVGTRDGAWSVYKSLNALLEELRHTLEDQRFGG